MLSWSTARLGDLVVVKHGYAFRGEFFSEEPSGDILLTPGNFTIGGGFKSGKLKFYRGETPDDFVLSPGDLLVTMTDLSKTGDTLGYPALVPDWPGRRFLHNQRIGRVLITDTTLLDSNFLFYLLCSKSYRAEVLASATGSTVRHTSPSRIGRFSFALPPLPEQKRIGAMLSAIDDKIELNRQMNETLEAMARALFRSWFVDFDPVRAKMAGRTPAAMDAATAALFPNCVESSVLGDIPSGWRSTTWGELVTLEYGKGLRGHGEASGSVPVYGTNGRIGWHDAPLCAHPGVIVGRKGAYRGIHFSSGPFYVIDTAFYLQARTAISWRWAYYELLRFDLNGMDSGSAIPSTSRPAFYGIQVCAPPISIQGLFQETLDPVWRRIEHNAAESRILWTVRDLLLPKLLSGELRIRDAERAVEAVA